MSDETAIQFDLAKEAVEAWRKFEAELQRAAVAAAVEQGAKEQAEVLDACRRVFGAEPDGVDGHVVRFGALELVFHPKNWNSGWDGPGYWDDEHWAVMGICPRCGLAVESPDCRNLAFIGKYIEQWVPSPYHRCEETMPAPAPLPVETPEQRLAAAIREIVHAYFSDRAGGDA